MFDTYIANHPQEASMMAKMPVSFNPKLMMLITGPVIGIVSGLILGLFAFIASKIYKNQRS
jgi:thiamine transporter ThiT